MKKKKNLKLTFKYSTNLYFNDNKVLIYTLMAIATIYLLFIPKEVIYSTAIPLKSLQFPRF